MAESTEGPSREKRFASANVLTPGDGRSSHTFQSLWFGSTISPYEGMCFRSFVDHGHSFHLYSYTPNLDAPDGVCLKDAEAILSKDEYFTYKKGRGAGSHSAFSNLFRYKLLLERGGWWVDTDVVCLSDNIPEYDEFFALESDDFVNGAILFFRPNDPLMRECMHVAQSVRDQAAWGEIGPRLITRMLKESARFRDAKGSEACYPVHHREALDVLRPEMALSLERRIQGSDFLHLWNEMFRRAGVAKTMLPPKGSLLRSVADRYHVDGWTGEYNADAIEQLLSLEAEFVQVREELNRIRKQENRNLSSFPERLRLGSILLGRRGKAR